MSDARILPKNAPWQGEDDEAVDDEGSEVREKRTPPERNPAEELRVQRR